MSAIVPPSLQALRDRFAPLQNANILREQALSLTDRIALKATSIVGTMGFFYTCMVMVTIPLLAPKVMPVVQYISSGYLQLILLPLIMVGQNLQGKHTELRAENDYQVNMKAEREIEVLYQHIEYQNAILLALMQKLDVKMEDVFAISEETYLALNNSLEEQPMTDG
jgi:hypothetical protein